MLNILTSLETTIENPHYHLPDLPKIEVWNKFLDVRKVKDLLPNVLHLRHLEKLHVL